MTQNTYMFAKRVSSDFHLFVRIGTTDCKIGELNDCGIVHVFSSLDDELDDMVNDKLEGDMSIRQMLVVVRATYEAKWVRDCAEARAEAYAERAWLRAAEECPEHREEMEREDAMGYT